MSALVVRGGGRPAAYKLKDGKRVPSVTTITGRFKDSGGLLHWAWKEGAEGRQLYEKRDQAADVGAWAHDLVEHRICGEEYVPPAWAKPEQLEALANVAKSFDRWQEGTRISFVALEMPLVSERFRFGGTNDAIGRTPEGLALCDWKSGAGVYPEHVVQVSAYVELWEEVHPGDRIETVHLLRVGKEHGEFSHHSWPRSVVDMGWKAFRMMRELYDIDRAIRAVAK